MAGKKAQHYPLAIKTYNMIIWVWQTLKQGNK